MKGVCTAKYRHDPSDPEIEMRFVVHSDREKWRVETMATKEPATFQWLRGLTPQDILFDIGANIGVYTIFAAMARRCRVFAFEPEALNYAALNENIHANPGLDADVSAFCMAASDTNGLDVLYLSEMSVGGSGHSAGEEVGYFLEKRPAAFRQGVLLARLGLLVDMAVLPSPTAVKIDVDGFESKVVTGLGTALDTVRTMIVECNMHLPAHGKMMRALVEQHGFTYDEKQWDAAKRGAGAFQGVGECVFTRPAGWQPPQPETL